MYVARQKKTKDQGDDLYGRERLKWSLETDGVRLP